MTSKNLAVNATRRPLVLSVSDTVASFIIPTAIAGQLCEVTSDGADCDINFGSASVTCVYGQASSVASNAITAHADSGIHLVSKVAKLIRFPKPDEAVRFAVDCVGSGSAKLYIQVVGG